MRGKVSNIPSGRAIIRITPAYAGKRSSRPIMNCLSQDHPCVCGEKKSSSVILMTMRGSPLRMRGKDHKDEVVEWTVRITPAYAGKRVIAKDEVHLLRDHPCVCGEKIHNGDH